MAARKKTYLVVVERESEAHGAYRWSAYCPELPGCVSDGKTRAHALKNIRDAIAGYLEALAKLRKPPARPTICRIAV